MGKQSNRSSSRYLPLVFVATFLVVVLPMLLVFWLRKSGVVTSLWAGMLLGVLASFLASYAGRAFWKTRTDSGDILFSDLMLWGWVQRWRGERRLNAAADLLGLTIGRPQAMSGGGLTNEQRASLLTHLTSGLEARDPYTHGHSRRVARHASNIAKRMGLSREEVAKIRAAGAMHDVGKVETPIAVLRKEGKLTEEEYAVIKRHPVDGAVMVATLGDDELTAMVRHHHERLDGMGYPDGLAGEAIPIGARILAVADTFDAITSTRPYRHAHAHKEALDILAAGTGTQLDPDAVRAFCACYSGRRPLAYWTILANGHPRLMSWLGSGLAPAKAASATSALATGAAVAAVTGAALGALVEPPLAPPPALADAGASAAPSKAQPGPEGRTTRMPGHPAPESSKPQSTLKPVGLDLGKEKNIGQHIASDDIKASGERKDAGPTGDGGQDEANGQANANGQGTGKADGEGRGGGIGNGRQQGNGHGKRNGQGNGHGNGNGNGNGHGKPNEWGHGYDKRTGQGNGHGNGDGNGDGTGDGTVHGNGDGTVHGNGNGTVHGNGNGSGNGNGNGNGHRPRQRAGAGAGQRTRGHSRAGRFARSGNGK